MCPDGSTVNCNRTSSLKRFAIHQVLAHRSHVGIGVLLSLPATRRGAAQAQIRATAIPHRIFNFSGAWAEEGHLGYEI